MRITTFLSVGVASLLLAGCGGADADSGDDGDASGGADGVTIAATEFAFDPGDFSLPADTNVDITLRNDGVVEHDLTVDELGIDIYADGGESTTDSVNVSAGTYTFYCSIPGHRDSGMEGTLTVG